MNNLSLANGDELFLVIQEFAEIEWRKYRQRIVEVEMKNGTFLREDHSQLPPFTTVRFQSENKDFLAKLKSAVEGYEGMVKWNFIGHERLVLSGINWVIHPKFVDDLRTEAIDKGTHDVHHYIEQHYPELAINAYADLLGLAEHVRASLLI
ncbi:hypothetical protein [Collimonas arenae]|uniref:hypothetical protein n=1 Tax=Collimonas arenae TaxID=279058 RepID=UPI00068BFFD1|nr:hypothetical protein [Collimonas arenae]